MEKPELTIFRRRGWQQPPKVQRLGEGKFDDELEALEAQRNELDEMMLELEALQAEKNVLPDGAATRGSRPFTPPASDQQPSPISSGIDLRSPSPPFSVLPKHVAPAQSNPDIQGFHMIRTAQPMKVPEQRSPRRSPIDFPALPPLIDPLKSRFPTRNAPNCVAPKPQEEKTNFLATAVLVHAAETLRQPSDPVAPAPLRQPWLSSSFASKCGGLVLTSATSGQFPNSNQLDNQDFATNIPTAPPPGVTPTSCSLFPSMARPTQQIAERHGGSAKKKYTRPQGDVKCPKLPRQSHNAVPIAQPSFVPRLPFFERR